MINNGLFRLERLQGESIQVGNIKVTPYSRRLSLGLPEWLTASKAFAFIHQQPAGVRVEQDGQVYEVPVRDYQSIIIALLLLITAMFVVITHCVDRKEKNQ